MVHIIIDKLVHTHGFALTASLETIVSADQHTFQGTELTTPSPEAVASLCIHPLLPGYIFNSFKLYPGNGKLN